MHWAKYSVLSQSLCRDNVLLNVIDKYISVYTRMCAYLYMRPCPIVSILFKLKLPAC